MRVRIHRGASEIGGNCIELESGASRIVLDVGRPLDAPPDTPVPLPDVIGFGAPDPSLLGVLISHAHQDHWGLVGQLPASTPVYMGEATHRILKEAAFFSVGTNLQPAGFLRHHHTFSLGPFTITPFINDHSAFDTYSLLVEADGRRLFYSADLQAHGRKAGVFEAFLNDPPAGVHVLLMEGTNLGRQDGSRKTERDVEDEMVATFTGTQGMVLAMYSAQNIDRLVTLFRASIRAGRHLVLDLYTASVAAATGNPKIPQAGFRNLLVYLPRHQRSRVITSGEFGRTDAVRHIRIFPEQLAARAGELVLTFRASMIPEIQKANCLAAATAVWSLWPGYLTQRGSQRLIQFLEAQHVPLVRHHASGHAYVDDLRRFAAAIAAARVVPIHTAAADRFVEVVDRVEVHQNGEWWTV